MPFPFVAAATIGAGIINGLTGNSASKRQQQTAREQMQLERDKMALSDRQFAAKYGFDKAQAEFEIEKFNRTQGNAEQTQALAIQNQLNRAPIADKAQAMLLARLGATPTAFAPRDMTRGTGELSRRAADPMGDVMSAMSKAAAGYKSGDGGMDFSLHRALISKLANPKPTRTPDPGDYSYGPKGSYTPGASVNTNSPGTSGPPPAGGGGTWNGSGTPGDEDEALPAGGLFPRRTWSVREAYR